MNDNFGNPGDIAFDDGVSRTSDGYYLVGTNTANGSEHRGHFRSQFARYME